MKQIIFDKMIALFNHCFYDELESKLLPEYFYNFRSKAMSTFKR